MPGTLWSTPFVVNTTRTLSQRDPDTATLSDGRVIVVWEDTSTPDTRIMYQLFDSDGTRIGGEELAVASAGNDLLNPSVVALNTGGFAIGYIQQDTAAPTQSFARIVSFDADGTFVRILGPNSDSYVDDQVHLTNVGSDLWLTYGNIGAASNSIEHARIEVDPSSDLAVLGYDTSVNIDNAGNQSNPHTAQLTNGNVVTIFGDTTEGDIEFVIKTSSGTNVSASDVDVDTSVLELVYHEVIALNNGGFVIAWIDGNGFPSSDYQDLYFSVYEPDGTLYSGSNLAATQNGSGQYTPVMVATADGFAIFWMSNSGVTSSYTQIRGRLFDGAGNPIGAEFVVGGSDNLEAVESDQLDATLMDDGRIFVTWEDATGDGSGGTVLGQIVDPRSVAGDVNGTGSADLLYGNEGRDIMHGRAGADELIGMGGDDMLLGGRGDDTLSGGRGDDVLEGGQGADELWGGEGWDIASYTSGSESILVTIGGSGVGGFAEGDQLRGIEGVIGGQGNDELRGDTNGNEINGASGNDLLFGYGGDDSLYGGSGNDVLAGGLGADLIDGGEGTQDRVSYSSETADLLVTLGGSAAGGSAQGDRLRGVEWITGGFGNDELRGNDDANLMLGQDGNDLLVGNGGDDDLRGGNGNDVFVGGDGADTFRGNDGAEDRVSYSGNATSVIVTLDNSFAASGGDATGDYFESIERLTGSAFADILVGDANGNVLDGYNGNDNLNGGGGNDLLIGGSGVDTFFFNTNFGKDRILDFADGTEKVNVASVLGASAGTYTEAIGVSGNVLVSFNGVDTIEFMGITNLALIDTSDFIF